MRKDKPECGILNAFIAWFYNMKRSVPTEDKTVAGGLSGR